NVAHAGEDQAVRPVLRVSLSQTAADLDDHSVFESNLCVLGSFGIHDAAGDEHKGNSRTACGLNSNRIAFDQKGRAFVDVARSTWRTRFGRSSAGHCAIAALASTEGSPKRSSSRRRM